MVETIRNDSRSFPHYDRPNLHSTSPPPYLRIFTTSFPPPPKQPLSPHSMSLFLPISSQPFPSFLPSSLPTSFILSIVITTAQQHNRTTITQRQHIAQTQEKTLGRKQFQVLLFI